jgi:hypothetical protein
MSIKKVPQKFETSDGRDFTDEKEAERHQQLIDARGQYQQGLTNLGQLLAERLKTADGKPFQVGILRNYYVIHEPMAGLPYLRHVHFSLAYGQPFGLGHDDDVYLIVREFDTNRTQREYKVSDLYADNKEACKALLAAQEERLKEITEQVEQLRSQVEGKK